MDRGYGNTTYFDGENLMETTSGTKTKRRSKKPQTVTLLDSPEKKRMRFALVGGEDLPEEMPLVLALRKLRLAEARPLEVRAELLECGYLTPAKAAKLLGVPLAEVKRRLDPKQWVADGHLPITKAGIPVSELLRAVKHSRKRELEKLANEVAKLVTVDGTGGVWMRRGSIFERRLGDSLSFLDVAQAAAELGLSKAAVERLVDDDGPASLFAQQMRYRKGWLFSPEEIAAYKRRLQRERTAAASATAA